MTTTCTTILPHQCFHVGQHVRYVDAKTRRPTDALIQVVFGGNVGMPELTLHMMRTGERGLCMSKSSVPHRSQWRDEPGWWESDEDRAEAAK